MYDINGSVRFKCAYLNIMTGYGVWLCSFRSILSILAEVGPGRVVYPSEVLCRTAQPQYCSPANITELNREQASHILAYPGQYSADQIKGKIVTTCFLEFFPTFVL